MIALLARLALGPAAVAPPPAVIIATPRGEAVVPVVVEGGVPLIASVWLAVPLGLEARLDGARATVTVGTLEFRFEIGSPFASAGQAVYALVAPPRLLRDTLLLPLPWLTDALPRAAGGRYRWIAGAARLEELPADSLADSVAVPPPAVVTPAVVTTPPLPPPNPLTGLRRRYTVVVDPGHGGRDPGNPGRYLPAGQTEKDVTLLISRLLRAELVRRGIAVRMTRTTDTLIALGDRGPMCRKDCDLFVSIHLNSMPRGRRQGVPNGAETYFLSDAKTEDQRRVAQMENDAIRFETAAPVAASDLGFILRDLQQNEYLRESARLADLVQQQVAGIHPGDNRGVQQAGLHVLSTAGRPAILVEAGFATNKSDGSFLGTALGQRKIAHAVADGIVAYLLEYERKSGAVAGAGR